MSELLDEEIAEALDNGESLTDLEIEARDPSDSTLNDEYSNAVKRAREQRSLNIIKAARQGDRKAKRKRDELEDKSTSKAEKHRHDAIKKTKKSQEFKKRRKRNGYESDDHEDASDDAWELFRESRKIPGQLEHCDMCGKRFTVTGYTKAGPGGGLLCKDCSKDIDKEEKENKSKKPAVNRKKRQQESKKMEGLKLTGAKSLIQLCIDVSLHHLFRGSDADIARPSLRTSTTLRNLAILHQIWWMV
jgi:DNA repair protein RAD7